MSTAGQGAPWGAAPSADGPSDDERPEDWAGAGRDDAVTSSLGIPLGALRAASPEMDPLFDLPRVRVERGDPDDDELAALVAGIMAVRAAVQSQAEAQAQNARPDVGGWSDRGRPLRLPPSPGPGAWRRSLHP